MEFLWLVVLMTSLRTWDSSSKIRLYSDIYSWYINTLSWSKPSKPWQPMKFAVIRGLCKYRKEICGSRYQKNPPISEGAGSCESVTLGLSWFTQRSLSVIRGSPWGHTGSAWGHPGSPWGHPGSPRGRGIQRVLIEQRGWPGSQLKTLNIQRLTSFAETCVAQPLL